MSRENIRFNGMNRNSNVSDSRVGDCEELINVKSENGALKIVKERESVSVDIPYRDVIIHDTGGRKNYIGKDSIGWAWFDPATAAVLGRLYTGVPDNTYIAVLNNMVVISDKTNIKTYTHLFSNGTYSPFSNGIDFDVSSYVSSSFYTGEHDKTENILAPSESQYLSGVQGVINKFKVNNKTYCEGVFVYAFTVTLYDGTETGMYGLRAIGTETGASPNASNAFVSLAEAANSGDKDLFTRFNWSSFFQSHMITVGANGTALAKYEANIKSVNLYASIPITRMPVDEEHVTLKGVTFSNGDVEALGAEFIFDAVWPKDSGIEKALLYRQKSWPLKEFCAGISYTFEFGGDNQATGKTMPVTSPFIERAGKMFSYNNRLHFFNSSVRLNVPLGNLYQKWSDDLDDVVADVYVFLTINGSEQVLKYSDISIARRPNSVSIFPAPSLPQVIVYPDSRAFKMLIVTKTTVVEGYGAFELSLGLQSSPAYNYAYAFGNEAISGGMTLSKFSEYNVDIRDTYDELPAVNVTAQGNPLVFPVEHSYMFPGTINTLAYATEPISQTQIGQYPLYIFTDCGIFAMEQGNGNVLYSNQVMINTDKCDNDVVQTRNGVVYIANGSIYILAGRNTLNISLPLDGPVDFDIREAAAYSQCCISDSLYNVGNHLSQVQLAEYLSGAQLVYMSYTDELIVSNPEYQYSYVFSFIYKSWHKITDTLCRVQDSIVQKYVFTSSSSAKAATGSIIISNAVIEKAHSFTAMRRAIYSGEDYLSAVNDRFSLMIDGVQVSSVNLRYPARLPIILALLCKDVQYLDCAYNGASHYLYSSIEFDEGAKAELIHSASGYKVFSVAFETYEAVASIPNKGIGENVIVVSSKGGSITTRALREGDTVLSIASELNTSINGAALMGVYSNQSANILNLTAITPGEDGNYIAFAANTGYYTSVYIESMTGGQDVRLGASDYSRLIDYSKETDIRRTIHIQSRPISLSQAYTIVRRMIMYCKADLSAADNLSMYLFASNNLKDWKCVAASQKSDAVLDHIRLQRSARAYKHYVIIIGGKVYSSTELSYITLELQERFESKIR